jgi:hypothetical protein
MWSIIDYGRKDFLRDRSGVLMFATQRDAEDWLLREGDDYGWTNSGTKYFCWKEEE